MGGRTLVGGAVVGLAVNAISDAYKGAAPVAIAGAVFFVLMVAVELRRLPSRAPVHRLVARSCLAGAAVTAIASLLVPSVWTGWMVLLAAALGTAGCVVPVSQRDMYLQLVGVAGIGGGVAAIGFGISVLLRSDLLGGVVLIGLGVAGIGGGIALLLSSKLLVGVAAIGLGVALIGSGTVLVQRSTGLLARLRALTADPGDTDSRSLDQ